MRYYCHLDSANDIEDTNLQLYSLRKAAEEWNDLLGIVNERGIENVDYLTERITFITNCLGLSISQLLGQNFSSSSMDRIESPSKLFQMLLNDSSMATPEQEKLDQIFIDFLCYYDAIRHFGKVKYDLIDELTLSKLNSFRVMTIEIWDIVISQYRQKKENDIQEFSSIGEIINFENLGLKE